ncbi:MAG TPA: hypothetical protein VM681_10850 [Candidatus Thermoplasmatota archaeon]|nr:hypothetical protein [Candidatus Thermoplasmatota archaeon]
MPEPVRCPVCRSDLGTPEEARALGAFVEEHPGHAHFFDSAACRDAFLGNPRRYHG